VQVSQDDIDQIMLAYNTSYTAFSEDVEEIIATVRRTRHLDEPDSVLKAQDLYGHLTALQQ
jgi:L-rhamnose isomerase